MIPAHTPEGGSTHQALPGLGDGIREGRPDGRGSRQRRSGTGWERRPTPARTKGTSATDDGVWAAQQIQALRPAGQAGANGWAVLPRPTNAGRPPTFRTSPYHHPGWGDWACPTASAPQAGLGITVPKPQSQGGGPRCYGPLVSNYVFKNPLQNSFFKQNVRQTPKRKQMRVDSP